MRRRGNAAKRAIGYLAEQIREARARGHIRLPSIKQLSAGAGVSPRTLWKAVALLRQSGEIAVIPGGGIFISSSPRAELDERLFENRVPVVRHRVSRVEQVRRSISHDLLVGRYRPGEILPTYKEMCHRYGACYLILRTALAKLVSEQRIEPYGKRYRVSELPVQRGRPVIVHIYCRHLGGAQGLVHAHPFSGQFWAEVEKHRVRLNIEVELVHQDAVLRQERPAGEAGLDEQIGGRTVLGCTISTLGLTAGEMEALLAEVERRRWRTSVLVEGTEPPIAPAHLRNPLLRFYTLAGGSKAGEIMGNFLVRLGHRHVAVITSSGRAQFTRRRIEGMRRVLEAAGESELRVVDATLEGWEAVAMRDPIYRTFRRSVLRYERATTPSYETPANVFGREAELHMGAQFLKRHLVPFFERLLQENEVTAWTAITDVEGLIALAYLRGNGVAVPGRISVTAFDNTVDSFGQGLTSYDFNVPAIVQAMFEHIMAPRQAVGRGETIAEIPGWVVPRQSSGPAPSRESHGFTHGS